MNSQTGIEVNTIEIMPLSEYSDRPRYDLGLAVIDRGYPLIHQSNQRPYHFLHGFIEYLNEQLDLKIKPTAFKGDIHVSEAEKAVPSALREILGEERPFWIVAAGGKRDFTIKWWESKRYQQVVDHFRGRLEFVQVGGMGHFHPELDGVLDLRGKTDLRQLIRLVHHAEGVLTPVSLLMHLAAAVPTKAEANRPKFEAQACSSRPCVVIPVGAPPPGKPPPPNTCNVTSRQIETHETNTNIISTYRPVHASALREITCSSRKLGRKGRVRIRSCSR